MSKSTHNFQEIDDTIPLPGSKRTLFSFGNFDHSSIPLEEERWPVMIIGSSMVGMTLGACLGYHGIRSISFDRHPSTAIHPRAALFLLRSIEIFRQLGLDARMTEESASNFDLDAGMIVVERLVGGKTLMSMQESNPAEVAKVTPCQRLWLTQNMFEPLLRKSARDFGAQQVFGEAVVHYEEQSDGVLVVVQDVNTKGYKKYKTDYLVACDGNRSPTRARENIEWHGPGVLGECISINFTADLAPYLGTRAVHGVTYINNPSINAGFRLESGGKRGFMLVTSTHDKKGFPPDSVSEAEAKRYFHDASGIEPADVGLRVDSISYWTAAGYTSDRFSSEGGRVFIMGDAAHVMPPTGGMGGNTGVQDAHNLAWKLSYCLRGLASPSLLHSYSLERQPVAAFLMHQAYSRFQKRVNRVKPDVDELPDINCEIGYRYPHGAFVPNSTDEDEKGSGDGTEMWEDPYSPSATAGSRLPHVEIVEAHDRQCGERGGRGRTTSTLDLITTKFVLFTTESESPWVHAVQNAGFPFSKIVETYALHRGSRPFEDPNGRVEEVCKLGNGGAVLIRPDGFIAWRGTQQEKGHREKLIAVMQTVLGKS